jgi:hypothetical protein
MAAVHKIIHLIRYQTIWFDIELDSRRQPFYAEAMVYPSVPDLASFCRRQGEHDAAVKLYQNNLTNNSWISQPSSAILFLQLTLLVSVNIALHPN